MQSFETVFSPNKIKLSDWITLAKKGEREIERVRAMERSEAIIETFLGLNNHLDLRKLSLADVMAPFINHDNNHENNP